MAAITNLVEQTSDIISNVTNMVEQTSDIISHVTNMVKQTSDIISNVTNMVEQTCDIISKTDYSMILLCVMCFIGILAILAIASNIMSIKNFILMGLDDGMTNTFLVLSATELIYSAFSVLMFISSVCHCLELMRPTMTFSVDPFSLLIYFANVSVMVHLNIQLITTFLAVARCMCVVKPIHFKNAFTKKRCLILLAFFWSFSLASNTPLYSNMLIVVQYDPKINVTRPSLWLSSNRNLIKNIIWSIEDATVPFCSEFIVIICLVVMSGELRRAAKFRMSSSRFLKQSDPSTSQRVSGKERLLIRQVALISGFYILTNTPKVASNLFALAVPQYTLGGKYNNLYLLVVSFWKLIETFNCSISFHIYNRCNPKFRSLTFKRLNELKS